MVELNLYDRQTHMSVLTYELSIEDIINLNTTPHGALWPIESHGRACYSIHNFLQNVFATKWTHYNTKEFYRETEEFLKTQFTDVPDYYFVYADPRLLSQVYELYQVRNNQLTLQAARFYLEAILNSITTSYARKLL